ncbi:MAG: glycosyltransferase [Actinobacteria bacterium]|nr:glycosyltransferase [Actinomycetota bacterium]
MQDISIIIPTLNEAENIQHILKHVSTLDSNLELIVVDGNSSDDTVEKAAPYARVIQSAKGRAVQMNAGAKVAGGDIFWFLHADCLPHQDSIKAMREALKDPEIVGGAFEYSFDHPSLYFRITEFTSNLKNHFLHTFYGDMGIFVHKSVFEEMGGYAEIPLMEDMEFCKQLKKRGKIIILRPRILTSARRWLDEGIARNVFRNWALQIAYSLGASPQTLTRWYTFGNKKP